MEETVKDMRHPYQCARNTVIPIPDSLDILTKIKKRELENDAVVLLNETDSDFVLSYRFKKIVRR